MRALRILIVEDNAMVATLLADLLETMGHETCAIETEEAGAVAAALLHRPDLMIIDAQLRRSSGLAILDKLAAASPPPHIFISGDIASLRTAHPEAVTLQKPFSGKELAMAIRRALDLAGTS